MKKTRVAILGGGWFGQFHLDNLLRMDDVEVAAFATANAPRLAALSAKAPHARAYKDQEALVAGESGLDALIVAVPPDRHDGIEFLAARKGIHLFMEKPLGVDLGEVLACEEAIAEAGIACSVGYQTRYNPQVDELKALAFEEGNEIGAVVAKWFGVMPPTPWWRVKARSGGQLAEQVTHMVDLLRYIFGDVKAVYSAARKGFIRGVPDYDVEDASATTLTFMSGLVANTACGCFVEGDEAESEIRIEMYGRRRRLFYEWDARAGWESKKGSRVNRFGNDFHFPALRTFIEAVRSGDASRIRSPYSDAVKTFKTTWAANLSMQTHAEVAVDSLSG